MSRKTTDKLTQMGRRRFMQSLAGFGISGAALNHMSKEALASHTNDPGKEVPVLKGFEYTNFDEINESDTAPERKPVYFTIPRDEWNVTEAAYDARQQIQDLFTPIPNQIFETDVLVTTVTSGQHREKAIIVPYPITETRDGETLTPQISYDEIVNRIPSEVTGVAAQGTDHEWSLEDIPVSVEREYEELQYFQRKYRPVPAGCQIQILPWDRVCTLGMPKYWRNENRWVFVTAGHCSNKNHKRKFHQPRNGGVTNSRIGTRIPGYAVTMSSFDAAIVSKKNGVGKRMSLAANGGGYRWPIKGTMSESWLRNLENNNGYLRFQGRTSGSTSGRVTAVGGSTFRTNAITDGGDSGGPHFYLQSDNDAWIGGIHRGSANGDAKATQLQNIENRYNLA